MPEPPRDYVQVLDVAHCHLGKENVKVFSSKPANLGLFNLNTLAQTSRQAHLINSKTHCSLEMSGNAPSGIDNKKGQSNA